MVNTWNADIWTWLNVSDMCVSVFVSLDMCVMADTVGMCACERVGSGEKEPWAQTKVGLCASSSDNLWKIPRQCCAKMPGPARQDSEGMWEADVSGSDSI